MSTDFFRVGDNSFSTRGFPWAHDITKCLIATGNCTICGGGGQKLDGDLDVVLEKNKGTKWPDVLGCGAYPLFIVSERTLDCWQAEGIEAVPHYRVHITGEVSSKLKNKGRPNYYWLDGDEMRGASVDFPSSGYVDNVFCVKCKRRMSNIAATSYLQLIENYPTVLIGDIWTGKNIFTTDISPTAFFCTEKIVACARKYNLTNFRFVSLQMGHSPH